MSTKKKSLQIYLENVYQQFISIKDDDLKKSQEVFSSVFNQVKEKMAEQCNYFKKYSSQVMYAGSVMDGIKISKMDEFDMDIVIRLPINYGDGEDGIIIENDKPGFIKMKIINAFDNLDKQKEWENCHKVIREWRDSDKYFLQSRFRRWLHGIVQKALNTMNNRVTVKSTVYLLTYKESGPAYTLNIKNSVGDEEFNLDVDIVPVIRFMYPRVPNGYRVIKGLNAKEWLVVPKPNKGIADSALKNRCWRLSFQEQERELIKDCKTLKKTLRLIKKLRDALAMKEIASYYIKTLFLWEVDKKKTDPTYWHSNVSVLFPTMVTQLHSAIENKKIPFFWNQQYNLIGDLKDRHKKIYTDKLQKVLTSIAADDVEKVASYLLSSEELKLFKNSDFYKQQAESPLITPSISGLDICMGELSLSGQVRALNNDLDKLRSNKRDKKIDELEAKLNDLTDRVTSIEDRLMLLESRDHAGQSIMQNSGSIASSLFGKLGFGYRTSVTEPKVDFLD